MLPRLSAYVVARGGSPLGLLGPAYDATREFVGELAPTGDDATGNDGGEIAIGTLDQPSRAAGQVVGSLGFVQTQCVVVDDVEVAFVAGRDEATIIEPIELRGLTRLLVDDELERESLAACAIARPMRDHRRGNARVADDRA